MGGLAWLTVYALAMAHAEAAVVIYLRRLYYADDPLALFPLTPLPPPDVGIEVARELATVVMILGVAFLHAKRGVRVFAAFLYVFGVWDIAYYAWLKLMLGWPASWLEWDVLFLIPWPWLGPWLAPALVAAAFAGWGARTLRSQDPLPLTRGAMLIFLVGAAIVVGTFLWPGLPLLGGDVPDDGYRPTEFYWSVFALGYAVMMAGLFASEFVKNSERR